MQVNLEKQAVIQALEKFEQRAREISQRIDGRRQIGAFEIGELKDLYRSFKHDVQDASKRGRVSHARGAEQNDWERYYFAPATMKAASALRAKSNSNPITSNWLGSLLDAETEFSYYLYQLQKTSPEDQ